MPLMQRMQWISLLATQCVVLSAVAQQPTDSKAPPPLGAASYQPAPTVDERPLTAQSFVTRAAVANMAEVELGELALTKSASADVKGFAQRLIRDHQASEEQLRKVAAAQKIALPAIVDEEHLKLKQRLSALQGKAFDVLYLQAMAKEHDENVAMFEAVARSQAQPAKIPEALKQFASQTLPTLRQHRDAVHALQDKAVN